MAIEKIAKGLGVSWEKDAVYSQALRVGDTIYISGQFSHDLEGNFVGEGDPEAQMRQIYRNVEALLTLYGATFDNIVEEVVYVTDIKASFKPISKVRAEIYSGLIPPANTLIQVARMTMGRQMIEMKCVAKV